MSERIKGILNEPLYQVAFFVFLFEAAFVRSYWLSYDLHCFQAWCSNIFYHGIGGAYQNPNQRFNYPPLITYPLFLFGKFQGNQENINRYFHFFKLFPLLFDFIAALFIVRFANDKRREVLLLLLLILNPVFIYNSYCWGQCDAVLSTLIFISFLSLWKEKLMWGVLFFVMAINFKIQAIIFFPPLVLLGLYKFWGKVSVKLIIQSIILVIVVQTIIVLPFILTGRMNDVFKACLGSVDFYPVVSLNAFNIWYFLKGEGVLLLSDTEKWHGLSYKYWGLIMFFGGAFFALFPLFVSYVSNHFSKSAFQSDFSSLLLSFALIPLLFFYFNTQMHERYVHPAFVFIALFSFSKRKYYLFVMMCLAYFGNLELLMRSFELPNYKILIFEPLFVSGLYGLLIISLFYFLYKPFVLTLRKQMS